MVRTKLKVLRVQEGKTQEELAELLGVSTVTYCLIERGQRRGSPDFWKRVQEHFNIKDADMWAIMN